MTSPNGGSTPVVAAAPWARVLGLALVLAAALVAACLVSLTVGARTVPLSAVWEALLGSSTGPDQSVVRDLRLPRTLLGIVAGSALGADGALMRAATRNPLADPGLLGVNAGAGFAIVLATGVLGITSTAGHIWFSFVGALVASVVVYALASGGRSSSDPTRLTLAGVALGAVLLAAGQGLALLSPRTYDHLRAWRLGTLDVGSLQPVLVVAPFAALGIVLGFACTRGLNAIALGEDVARALGADVGRTRLVAVVAVALLAGSATAAAGSIGLVGLMVPYLVRRVAGPDQRAILVLSVLAAPVLLVVADVVGRVVHTSEVPVGVVTATIGAPMLVAVARSPKVRAA